METIKDRNEKFKKMTLSEKRIAIAKDVIENIESKKFVAKRGTYFVAKTKEGVETNNVQLQELILCGDVEQCTVCGIGAIFASKVCVSNDFKVNKKSLDVGYIVLYDTDMISQLNEIFNEYELRYIEIAFEGILDMSIDNDVYFSEKETIKAMNFYETYPDQTNRLIAIMKNIIKNDGVFTP